MTSKQRTPLPKSDAPNSTWRVQKLGQAWQFRFFKWIQNLGGRRLAYILSDFVSFYYFVTKASIRARTAPYLKRRFPDHRGSRRFLDGYQVSRAFARILVDTQATQMGHGLQTQFQGKSQLEALLEEGKGLIILTAHVGAWQLGMRSLSIFKGPIGIVTEAADGPNTPFHGLDWQIIRPQSHLGGVPQMMSILQNSGVLCIMGDRSWPSSGQRNASEIPISFLGDLANFPLSPYLLSSATQAPIAVLFPFKPDPYSHEMQLLDIIRIPPGLGRKTENYHIYASRFASALENFLEQHPYEYFNFFNLWESQINATESTRS